jgi:hypothetical protein
MYQILLLQCETRVTRLHYDSVINVIPKRARLKRK